MPKRTAIKNDLFASQYRREKIDDLGYPLAQLVSHIDFTALAERVEQIVPRPDSSQGGVPGLSDGNDGACIGYQTGYTTCRMNKWSIKYWIG